MNSSTPQEDPMSFMSLSDARPRKDGAPVLSAGTPWPWLTPWSFEPWSQTAQWWLTWWGGWWPSAAQPGLQLMLSPGDAGAPVAVAHASAAGLESAPPQPALAGERPSAVVTPIRNAEAARKTAPDDLTRIEGIGPKIAERLQAAGIERFDALAATPVARLQEILLLAGARFKLAVPDSWPEQAALLAQGDEAGFAALTARLTAGRR
jgi:predicted flap endonuclease-1-like 5' DNA nuclease